MKQLIILKKRIVSKYMLGRILSVVGWVGLLCFLSTGCSLKEPADFDMVDSYPAIFPDYIGVTIPPNIAPLRFELKDTVENALAVISRGDRSIRIPSSKGAFLIPMAEWKHLLEDAAADSLVVKVYTSSIGKWTLHKPFSWYVVSEPIDPYLVYRLIEPGYELWNQMGIYQRDLSSFEEEPILTNKRTDNNCMNCHSFNQQSPDTLLFHQRAKNGGTYIATAHRAEKIDAKLGNDFAGIVYPYWHPSGKCVAFSSNVIRQGFARSHINRVEVFDHKSDLVFYDVLRHEIWSDSIVTSPHSFETFPCFSRDGKKLYFCSAKAVDIPERYEDVRYNLCTVDFDLAARKVGSKVDTLVSVNSFDKSVSFPRISPDGRLLVFVMSDFGNFSIWHREADLYSLDLCTGTVRSLNEINSNETESYHSWSSNGKWMVFSSRRIDGLYTHPHLTYVRTDGTFTRPLVIPQEDPSFYHHFMKSFNIPELLKGKVRISKKDVWKVTHEKGIKLKWADTNY